MDKTDNATNNRVSLLNPPLPQKAGETLHWGNLQGASLALAIRQAAHHAKKPLLIITPSSLEASQIQKDIDFFMSDNEIPVRQFPDWETLPYDHFSPHHDIISQRLATLFQMSCDERAITLAPIKTLLQRIAPRDYIEASSFILKNGDSFDPQTMRERLTKFGYICVNTVMAHGEFCLRGSVFDLFPMGSPLPYRIELFDNDVDSIRTFDPDNQRTIEKTNKIHLLPAREFPLDETGITTFRQQFRDRFAGNPADCPIYQNISHGICSAGIEYYLPLFFQQTASLLDYFSSDTLVIFAGDIHKEAALFWKEIEDRYLQCNFDRHRPLLPPNQIFIPVSDLFEQLKTFTRIKTQEAALAPTATHYNVDCEPSLNLAINHKQENPLQLLSDFISQTESRILICAETNGRREILLELFNKHGLKPHSFNSWADFLTATDKMGITIASLTQGFNLHHPEISVISESQLYGQQIMQRRRRQKILADPEYQLRNLAELTVGAPVVHLQHGIGRYLGLQILRSGELENEYLTLEYAAGDKLYIPISQLHLVSRYSGVDTEHAPLHQLGSKKWQKAKEKAAEQIRDVAAELLEIYAKRAAEKGHSFEFSEHDYESFAQSFPFEETPDQIKAIDCVIADMKAATPMDRLVCGDVGFGKTEVAMRAAFIAVANKKQVAVLVPTTLLAEQHYQTFCDRFAEWPVNIDVVSRFKTAKEQKIISEHLSQGKIDILIGTHKLLQDSLKFKSLGLVVIDEEHRFGVHQKDQFKKLRATVDILTLTATPIPRTLNMALSGIRDLSIIATPPRHRLSIKTFVHARESSLIREALMREILRGGQVFFLHNKVDTIEKTADEIQKLVPEARVDIGHGQMRERQLEKVMSDFYHQRFNVLVCTTIIETGIDIPTANTIIIDRADMFGLAQLHQLRGRVGRSHHQAYAYLLTPDQKAMTADALKRLDAISSLEDLGAGFTLASHDLEIRGSGELLGDEQSGNINEIGLTLYTELLEKAVDAFKQGHAFSLDGSMPSPTEIDLKIPAFIPDAYLPDVHSRLVFYKRIANSKNNDELAELQVEMIDRFGKLPEQTQMLMQLTQLRQRAEILGIRKIDSSIKSGKIEFSPQTSVDPRCIIQLLQDKSQRFRMEDGSNLRFTLEENGTKTRIQQVEEILNQLST